MAGNESLGRAKEAQEDEFYTQINYIEDELRHYREHFNGKIVYCNCDDPRESHFWRFFAINFEFLQLNKLIATHYDAEKPTYKLELTHDITGDGLTNEDDVIETPFSQNGDFRSPECVELLQEADIVVTNPPFSLFREYVSQLLEYDKKFIIIGNQNAITYREIFPLLKDNKMWMGYHVGDMKFKVPDYYTPRKTRFWIDETGQKWRSMGNICWFTNLDIPKRHEEMILYKSYNPEEYPQYVNYDGIEVSKVKDIPFDYDGVMGVPVTFLDKYNPDQFEIIGIDGGDMGVSYGVGADLSPEECRALFREHRGFRRGKLCYRDENGKLAVCYRRILVKRK